MSYPSFFKTEITEINGKTENIVRSRQFIQVSQVLQDFVWVAIDNMSKEYRNLGRLRARHPIFLSTFIGNFGTPHAQAFLNSNIP